MLIIMDHIAAYHNLNDDRPQASRFCSWFSDFLYYIGGK